MKFLFSPFFPFPPFAASAFMQRSLAVFLCSVLLLSGTLLAQSKKELNADILILERTRDALENQYWQLKQQALKERERITEELATLDDTLKTVFERRNSISEELFLVQGNFKGTEERQQLALEATAVFAALVTDKLDARAEDLKTGFPSEIERELIAINRLRAQQEQLPFSDFMNVYLDYVEQLIDRGEQIEVYTTNILNPITDLSEQVRVLRVGFIHAAYAGDESVGMLLRSGGLTGTRYEWRTTLPETTANQLRGYVNRAYNNAAKPAKLTALIDPTQSGTRTRTFLEESSGSWWAAFVSFFVSGGFMMYPLALLAIVAVIISIERLYYFSRNRLRRLNYGDEVIALLARQQRSAAQALLQRNSGFVAELLKPFFTHVQLDREGGERLLDEQLTGILPRLEKRLATLAVLGTIAPLLGLLGTVSGMIELFDVITLFGNNNPRVLAGGISVALVTTQTGLSLAVPIVLLHHLLSNYKIRILERLENLGILALDSFAPFTDASADAAAPAAAVSADVKLTTAAPAIDAPATD